MNKVAKKKEREKILLKKIEKRIKIEACLCMNKRRGVTAHGQHYILLLKKKKIVYLFYSGKCINY